MATPRYQSKRLPFSLHKLQLFGIAMAAVLLMVWAIWSSTYTWGSSSGFLVSRTNETLATQGIFSPDCAHQGLTLEEDLAKKTFYDDPKLSYSIDKPIKNWDKRRQEWLKYHPPFTANAQVKIFLVTGSQPSVCKNPIGDNLLLRLFKNKVDYCRINGVEIFYNNAFLHPKMTSYWAKIPIIRAAMLAHPEAEWIWWVDSDAVFTDMDFKLPLERYKDYNLVVDGWPSMVYESRSWIGLNAGVLLLRNCQWSMRFLETWATMGPQSSNHEKWGKIISSTLTDKTTPDADDQSALVYLLLKQKRKWSNKVYIENEYCFQGYWLSLVNRYDNITKKYEEIKKRVQSLRRRHAEVVSQSYGALMEQHLKEAGYGKDNGRRPFITHFTGCQPCSGDHNPIYPGDSCLVGMEKALNFADDQVLQNYGFKHPNLLDSSSVSPLPFDIPA